MCVQYRYLRGISTEMSVGMYHVRYSLASYGPSKGGGNSTAVDSDVAVEEARRGSRIRLVLGGDLHRLAGLYGFAGAG